MPTLTKPKKARKLTKATKKQLLNVYLAALGMFETDGWFGMPVDEGCKEGEVCARIAIDRAADNLGVQRDVARDFFADTLDLPVDPCPAWATRFEAGERIVYWNDKFRTPKPVKRGFVKVIEALRAA